MDQQKQKQIKIRPPQYQKYREGVVLNSEILPCHFLTLIVGRPGCGKSHLLYELLTNDDMYFKKFNFIYYITPSKIGDIELSQQIHSKKFDLKWIYDKITEINNLIKERQKEKKPIGTVNVLFVFDDVVGDLQKLKLDPLFTSLFYNRRHLIINGTISIIITSQYYKAVPRLVRANATSVIIYDIIPEDFKIIQREVIYCKDQQLIFQIAEKIFATKYKFLYIRLDNGDIYSNFDKKIYSPDDEEKKIIPMKQKSIEYEGEEDEEQEVIQTKVELDEEDEEQKLTKKVKLDQPVQNQLKVQNNGSMNKVFNAHEYIQELYKKYGI